MTRINIVPPEELTDQHLMREYQELPRILGLVRKALAKGKTPADFKIASDYLLGAGHVTFFYDKLSFLKKRQDSLIAELIRRKYNIAHRDGLDLSGIPIEWINDYSPTAMALSLSRARILEKIMMKPDWYKYYGKPHKNIDISDK